MSRRRRLGGALLVCLVLAGGALCVGMPGDPVVEAVPTKEAPAPSPLPVAEPAPPPVPTDPPPTDDGPAPHSAAVAQHELANALGLYTVRCFVGVEHDRSDFVGSVHRPRSEAGWLTAVVTEPRGIRAMEHAVPSVPSNAAPRYDVPFVVRWDLPEDVQHGLCEVVVPERATLEVNITNEGPLRSSGVLVSACGSFGRVDDGHVVLEVFAEATAYGCSVRPLFDRSYRGSVEVPRLGAGERGSVDLTLVYEPPDPADDLENAEALLAEAENEAEIAQEVMRAHPPDSPAGRWLSALIKRQRDAAEHHARMADRAEERLGEPPPRPLTPESLETIRAILEEAGVEAELPEEPSD